MRKVEVPLGTESYTIFIDALVERDIVAFTNAADFSKKALIITDTNVGPLYAEKLKEMLWIMHVNKIKKEQRNDTI